MKLKSLMNEYLSRENEQTSSLDSLGILNQKRDSFPCKVGGKSTWELKEDASSKVFSFSSRESLKSFCEYILDLESYHGIFVSLQISSDKNTVEIEVPHRMLGEINFKSFFNEIDNIHQDVIMSFRNE